MTKQDAMLPRHRRRVAGRWLLSILLLGVLACVGTLAAMAVSGSRAAPQPADVIIILGARVYPDRLSTSLRARLDLGLELYQAGLAKQIIVSGGQGPDEPTTEALAMQAYLVRRGVDQQAIHLEQDSYSTYDNLFFSRQIMQEQGFGSALLVTSDYHVLRSRLIAKRLGIASTAAAAPLPVPAGLRWRMIAREVLAVWRELLLLPLRLRLK